jgi:hypothetical protein
MAGERHPPWAPIGGADDLFLSARLEGATTVVRRGGPRTPAAGTRALAVAIAIVLVAGVGTLVSKARGELTAGGALAAAQAAVHGDDAYRVLITLTGRTTEPEDDESPESGATTDAIVVSPERWRALDAEFDGDDSYDGAERRRLDGEMFVRERGSGATRWDVVKLPPPPDEAAELAHEYEGFQAFQSEDDPSDELARRRLVLAFYAHVLPISYDPANVEDLVLQATKPVIEERLADDAVRLRVEVAPLPEIAAVADEPIVPMDLLLELDGQHRPRAATFEMADGPDSLTLELEFSDWGAPLTVRPPDEDDVERTPWVDEEGLAEVDPALLLLPAALPDDLELVSAEVDGDDDEEFDQGDCRGIEFEYATRSALEVQLEDYEAYDGPELELYILPASCEEPIYEDQVFDEQIAGRPAIDVGSGEPTVLVGDAAVSIFGTLDDDEIEQVVRSLEPVTPEQVLARFPDWLPEITQSRYA